LSSNITRSIKKGYINFDIFCSILYNPGKGGKMAGKDYYNILGIPRNAVDKDIKSAYRKMARKYHPDVNPGDKAAEARFKEINEAFEVLSDADKKKKYDQYGSDFENAEAYARAQQQARQQQQQYRTYGRAPQVVGSRSLPTRRRTWGTSTRFLKASSKVLEAPQGPGQAGKGRPGVDRTWSTASNLPWKKLSMGRSAFLSYNLNKYARFARVWGGSKTVYVSSAAALEG
jgi:curved DNA-binding protein CbpA